jgi:thiol-disulfide isomerase/thioredoxin
MVPILVLAALSVAASGQQAGAADYYHVVEVFDSDSTSIDQLISVLTDKLGATEDKVQPLIGKLEKHGKAVLVAGSEESCNEAAKMFIEIGMKAEVRPLSVTDMPSEYDESDVVVAGAEKLQEVLEGGKGALVAFHAPWCGHCKTMIPALKEAASTLKADGVPVLAIDGQSSPELAAQLGVRAYPALKWLKLVSGSNEDEVALGSADYNGPRDAASLVKFAKAASAATAGNVSHGATTCRRRRSRHRRRTSMCTSAPSRCHARSSPSLSRQSSRSWRSCRRSARWPSIHL